MTGTAPLISVVMPAYNAAAYLPATVRSVLRQTFRDIELLVVDDGSTDDTAAAALDAAEGDARLRVISPGVNQGRSAARNLGIDAARGDWVCPTDADDLWARGRLAALVRAAHRFPLATAVTDDVMGFRIDASGEIRLGHRYASRASWWVGGAHVLERRGWYVDRDCHMRPIIRRDFLTATGLRYPVEMSSGEDLCFLTQVAFSPSATFTVRVAEPRHPVAPGTRRRPLCGREPVGRARPGGRRHHAEPRPGARRWPTPSPEGDRGGRACRRPSAAARHRARHRGSAGTERPLTRRRGTQRSAGANRCWARECVAISPRGGRRPRATRSWSPEPAAG